ncbi:MAG: O-acetylhomoserine aminocarboxypropyltransferase/cysteine synthase, partial [Lachnospiraceae bacterium]|nr:O-acetylhomoserine aminocarboxypropyltransferase/cysteine synthase [Lachnospiraceae bacterium]
DDSEHLGKLFALEAGGYFYSRLQNPTNDLVAAKICELEGGVAAMLTSSGQAAIHYAILNICEAGDHVVLSNKVYGGTFNLIAVTMKKMGVESTVIDPDASDDEINKAFRANTKCMVAESVANPALVVLDIEKIARIAHNNQVPLIIDNTLATPINCNPFKWGADIIVHSTTKYMDGHAMSIGGVIIDSGNFDFAEYPDKFPGLCTPDATYQGVIYTERFGKGAYITKATVQLMRDLGSCQAPQNAFYVNIGLETLALRMERHCANAQAVAEFLAKHDSVEWVKYPGLPSDQYYGLAGKYMPKGTCGVIAFGVKGGRRAAEEMMLRLKMIAVLTHVADARTCALHPASHTHRQLTDEQLKEAGVKPEMIRLSVGIEHIEDILADLKQAL